MASRLRQMLRNGSGVELGVTHGWQHGLETLVRFVGLDVVGQMQVYLADKSDIRKTEAAGK